MGILTKPLSEFRRSREILRILHRHGFGNILNELGYFRLPFLKKKIPQESLGKRICSLFEDLGPVYIKLGQILSTRLDLLPHQILEDLGQLQDHVLPLLFSEIQEDIALQFSKPLDEVFDYIAEEPLASASIAQVHRARLKTGEEVVLKIRRPGIQRLAEMDLMLLENWLHRLVPRMKWLSSYNILGIFEEFSRSIYLEMDLLREARNLVRIQNNLSSYPWVKIPKVYWNLSSSALLVLEYIEGVKVSDYQGSLASKKILAERGARAIFHQVFLDGLFHGDPHPGNILILPDEKISFIDFGLMGRLDYSMKNQIYLLIQGVLLQDADQLGEAILQICRQPKGHMDFFEFKRDLLEILDHFYGLPMKFVQLDQVISQLFSLARKYKLYIPSEYTLITKSLLTIEKIAYTLDPDFQLVESLQRFLEKEVFASKTKEHAHRLRKTLLNMGETLESLPFQIKNVLNKLEQGTLGFELRQQNIDSLENKLDLASKRITSGLILCALIIGSALIITSPHRGEYTLLGYDALGLLGFFVAGFIGVMMALSSYR
ncbi:MAG: AarF/ABC1/UbiB kinase family protein [Planctomycetota bacterium]|nr:MAG: AarF/ABC1/UbiB kinase family protein [Planctomycetota bacterium]